jgi:hypothetical protein
MYQETPPIFTAMRSRPGRRFADGGLRSRATTGANRATPATCSSGKKLVATKRDLMRASRQSKARSTALVERV